MLSLFVKHNFQFKVICLLCAKIVNLNPHLINLYYKGTIAMSKLLINNFKKGTNFAIIISMANLSVFDNKIAIK